MDKFDSFNAPQFIDFENADMDNDADQFFDMVAQENGAYTDTTIIKTNEYQKNSVTSDNSELYEINLQQNDNHGSSADCNPGLRKSLSMGNLHIVDVEGKVVEEIYIIEEQATYSSNENLYEDTTESVDQTNINAAVTGRGGGGCSERIRKSLSVGNLNVDAAVEQLSKEFSKIQTHKYGGSCRRICNNKKTKLQNSTPLSSQERLNQLAQPKYSRSKDARKFVSIAEFIKKFENSTPLRFKGVPTLYNNSRNNGFKGLTIPYSPALQTKIRSRPVKILSQQEREEIEFENQQRFKIKAHPLNKKIFQGPIKPMIPMEKKPPTVPEPFNLTEVPNRKFSSPKPKYEFHANPVPKFIKSSPRAKEKTPKKQSATKPITPTFMKNFVPKCISNEKQPCEKKVDNLKLTVPQPFSFADRDKMLPTKREELIKKVLEQERAAREFHAKPVPAYVNKSASNNGSLHSKSSHEHSEESLENTTVFKARPATVLYKEPFIPKKPEKPLTETLDFKLNSEIRAQEREEFNRRLEEKNEIMAMLRRNRDEERLKLEEEERAKIRKELEFKAQPIKKYKETIIKPSNLKPTVAMSPAFQKKIGKENIPRN